ncbi:hypothetical protein N7448_010619 [Penicillium atrosanguineum]|uniref:SnoaL-like domain-containing protein n=1 Tax=Penicillium atrosanguineum TaxID=1132637 RepID=A0A9W9GGT8_9EURO|nr:uncharacterized protein N7443_007842 [Penicillium atrosanguineum]KAJ5118912.1 hypothetical protein N7526_010549 [Penicillium atrosanguineum]KAJ5119950.1 hypothetical protein N7448_010619 [Penicillium atrosanguineum]KAJ5296949.1 hypothetical protein N7443_007842 [Penicillium atrosanguineum]KAJ5299710.1 hypothetical protein N7476_011267 [Penicillium atrosanguineum]
MKLEHIYVAFYYLLSLPIAIAGPSCCRDDISSAAYHDHILNNYIAIWAGDSSLIGSTFHSDVVLEIDRFPSASGKGSSIIHVSNRTQMTAFVERSRSGWKEYYFEPISSVAANFSIAVRWRMHGVMGSNFTSFSTPLKAGDHVTYNGTDFLVQDHCTGLIREAYIASDNISFLHAMGLTAITV